MKILFYIDSMQRGGAQRVMANLVEHYSINNAVVLVNDIVPERDKAEYGLPDSIKRIFLDNDIKNGRFQKNICRIIKLRKVLKKEKPDVVVSFLGPPNIRCLLSTVFLNVKKIVSVRNDPNKEYGNGLKKIIARLLFCLADGCVFQTQDAKNYFPKCLDNRSRIIFNPVNPVFYKYSWKDGTSIVTVGRLIEQKNPLLLLEAFSDVVKKFPEVSLLYCGDGPLRNDIEERAKQLGISASVKVTGNVQNVAEIIENCSVFVLASDYEGMPNALMEAMAVGAPVISTDCPCGGPRMLITDNSGVLVKCNDHNELSSQIKNLLANNDEKIELGKAAKKRASEFSPDIILSQWDEIIIS